MDALLEETTDGLLGRPYICAAVNDKPGAGAAVSWADGSWRSACLNTAYSALCAYEEHPIW